MSEDRVEVRVRDCACPEVPHEGGDLVYLRRKMSLEGGLAAEAAIINLVGDPTIEQRVPPTLGPIYVRYGAVGWNLTDADGNPVPFDVTVLLDDYTLGRPLWDAADDLYSEAVLAPLVQATRKHSRNGQTAHSTSANRVSRRKRRSRSEPSSPESLEATQRSTR